MAARGVVNIRIEFSDEELEAIARTFGGKGRASRETVRLWVLATVRTILDEAVLAHDESGQNTANRTPKQP